MTVRVDYARTTDPMEVQTFIDQHWRRGHVLAQSRALLDWQYLDRDRDRYNVLIARDTRDERIEGILGFVPSGRYDPSTETDQVLWLALWKVRDDCRFPGVGLRLLHQLRDEVPHAAVGTAGVTEEADAIYRALGFESGEMHHYYLINPDVAEPRLTRNAEHAVPPSPGAELRPMEWTQLAGLAVSPPTHLAPKAAAYLAGRYANHPFFTYRPFLVTRDESRAVIVVRRVEARDARALRIIDLWGDITVVANNGGCLVELLRREGAELVELLAGGPACESVEWSGFHRRDPSDPHVMIPIYFDPFVAENAVIRWAGRPVAGEQRPLLVLRGDADQDRPNRLKLNAGRLEW